MGSNNRFFDEERNSFDVVEYISKKTIYVDGLKIKVIDRKDQSMRPNTPIKAGTSNAYVIIENDKPKQIAMYALNKAGENVKSKDIDLEVHTHKVGYSGDPHIHDYAEDHREQGRAPTKQELDLIKKIVKRLQE